MEITLHFVGGTSKVMEGCKETVYGSLLKWLNNAEDRKPFVINRTNNKGWGAIIPRDNLLFIDIS